MEETLRAAGYRRVSMREQVDGFSLDAQENNIRKYASDRGWQLVQLYTDAGISAKKDSKRPQLAQLILDAQAGRFDVVIVDKIDRFYRHLSGLLNALDRLNEHGVSFVSVQERLDFTTPWGKLTLTMLGMLAEIYIDNLRQETRKGKQQRAREGLWNGNIPFGYCKGLCSKCEDRNGTGYCPEFGQPDKSDGKTLIAHPVDCQAVRLMYELYLSGLSDIKVAEQINHQVFTLSDGSKRHFRQRSTPGQKEPGALRRDFARGVLTNIFYTGKVAYYSVQKPRRLQGVFPGKHPALVTETVFQQVAELREVMGKNCRNRNGNPARLYPLTGLIHCGICGWPMRGVSVPSYRFYRDASQIERRGLCRQPNMRANRIEMQARDYLLAVVSDWTKKTNPEMLLSSAAKIEEQLGRLQMLFVQGEISRDAYESQKGEKEAALKDLSRKEYRAILAQLQNLQTGLENWPRILPTEQKRLLRVVTEAIFVEQNALVALQPTFAFLPLFLSPQGEICNCGPDGIRTRDLGLDRAAC